MKKKICSKCVMDETDSGISFNEFGICNYCVEHEKIKHNYIFTPSQEQENLNTIANSLLKSKKGKYDCIIGLSGGVDSSYLAFLAHKMNLTPLCVHFDNGWNSEIAVGNINKIVKKFNFDLVTYVINWEEFRDLQRSFIKANVIDLEMLSDHAIFAALFKIRKEHNIKYVLSGTNFATEFGLPLSWIWSKMDWKNIKSIHDKFGTVKLKTYPHMSGLRWALISRFSFGGVFLEILNKVNYSKAKAISELKQIGWQEYGGKHYESIITKFYQAYILPKKFNVDKRIFHLSALIRNNEISRDEALTVISKPTYEIEDFSFEREYFLKKLGFTEEEFNKYIESPAIGHMYYGSDRKFILFLKKVLNILKKRQS